MICRSLFFVIATQNPNQNLGTFPLPESQLDRFMMSLELNYASKKTEIEILKKKNPRDSIKNLEPLLNAKELVSLQKEIDDILVSDSIANYVGQLLENSRLDQFAGAPVSTRAGISLIRAAKAWAYLENRNYLLPEDVQAVLLPILGHRIGGTHGLRQGREWTRSLQSQTEVPR